MQTLLWIILAFLASFPWLAPHVERACLTYAGFGQPDAEPNKTGLIDTSGHLHRAKAEGVGQPRTF